MNFVLCIPFQVQPPQGMRVSPGCLFNTLSTQCLLLTMGTQYVGNSCLDHTLWEGVPEGTWKYHSFHICEKVQTPKVPGRLEALSHWQGPL